MLGKGKPTDPIEGLFTYTSKQLQAHASEISNLKEDTTNLKRGHLALRKEIEELKGELNELKRELKAINEKLEELSKRVEKSGGVSITILPKNEAQKLIDTITEYLK